jgi:SGNH domain (fused to AT3 domains)
MAALSLLVAVVSFVLVGRPIRRMQLIVRRPALGLAGGAALVATSLAVVSFSGPLAALRPGPAVAAPTGNPRLTVSQLAADLRRGANTGKVPANLDPPLRKAADAKPLIAKNGCSLFESGVKSKPCIYGATKSHTSVVLFGDSHAATWFPALDWISKQQHWRLVDFSKAACPPPEVVVLWFGTRYPECPRWRANALKRIAEMHPALVVMAGARYQSALVRPLPGVPTGHGNTWLNGLAATFVFLRKHAQHVVFISDVPTMKESVPDCVSHHMSDVTACTTERNHAIFLPHVKAAELALARQEHINTIDPTSWFCTPTTCPAIVGNIILYRDNAHVIPQWSRFIAPVLSDALRPIMPTA